MKDPKRGQVILASLLLLAVTAGCRQSLAWDSPAVGHVAPNAVFTTGSTTHAMSQFKGHKVMLWLLSTWCSSCQEGLRVLAKHRAVLAHDGVTVIVLENFNDGGYGGVPIAAFAKRYGASVLHARNWLFGEASRRFGMRYNPRHYPDIYYLIDRRGTVRAVNGAPSATFATILQFAEGR